MWAAKAAVGDVAQRSIPQMMAGRLISDGGFAAMPKLWSGCCAGAVDNTQTICYTSIWL